MQNHNPELRQYVYSPRKFQGHIGGRGPRSSFREITRLSTVSRGFKILYFCTFLYGFKVLKDRKSEEDLHDIRMFEASVEANDWKCYHGMRQYNVECSTLDP